ncbi:Gfo/Idh/MocA family oxidoreductase [Eubacteriales bacterium OttesenSCG-928-M02]|nr:Gfo/Idh/MocA family oxidoreductase [Eubacteriales bacterium OttesenSCG-928-M02]
MAENRGEMTMVKWGIIGLGNIAQRFIKGLSYTDGVLVAGASRTAEKRADHQARFPEMTVYGDYEELLGDPNVDAVYIALPHGLHREWSIKAMAAGKAVLCEKPAGLNPDEVREMVAASQKYDVFFMEALKTRFIPLIQEIKKDLVAGIIGKITKMECSFCTPPSAGPMRAERQRIPAIQRGVLLDIGPYPIGFLLDMMEGVRVLNLGASVDVDEEDVDRYFTVNMAFINGVLGIAHGGDLPEADRMGYIHGTDGVMEIPTHYRPEAYKVTLTDGRVLEKRVPIVGDDFTGEIAEVHRCLSAGLTESPRMGHGASIQLAEMMAWAYEEVGRHIR